MNVSLDLDDKESDVNFFEKSNNIIRKPLKVRENEEIYSKGHKR